MSNVKVVSKTQRIVMNSATSSISVINAGPPGPSGFLGSDAHILDVMDAALIQGSGIEIDRTEPGQFNIINTGAVGNYTSENARDDIAAALVGATDRVLVTPDDTNNLIGLDLDPVFLARVTALEQAKSLIQYKDSTSASGSDYMNLTGSAGYIDAAYHVSYNVAGDLTVIARVQMPSSAPGASFTVAGRWGSSAALGQWRLLITTSGQMTIQITVNGTTTDTATTTAAAPLAYNGAWIWVRFSRTASDGLVDFYTGADDGTNTPPASWTTFQLNRATNVGALNAPTSIPISIGSYNAGVNSPFTGKIGRVEVFAGLNTAATLIADANANDWVSGTTWVGGAGRTWTIHPTASIVEGGTNAISNTNAEFTLAETDAFASIPVKRGDTLMWSAVGCFINTSGSAVNFTPKLQINGVDLFTFPAISIPSTAAGQTYRWAAAVRVEINDPSGTKQIAEAEFNVYAAVTGTDLGSAVMSAPITGGALGGVRAEAVSTFTTIPVLRLRNTMATAASTISSRSSLTQLFLSVS